jgi:heme-degrading monooxygenase HmoA
MYARVTLLEIDVLRVDIDDAVASFEADVLPALREQPGYHGVYVLTTTGGRGVLMSLWETEDQADAGSSQGHYADTLARYMTLFRAPPGRERYQVVVADLPATERS